MSRRITIIAAGTLIVGLIAALLLLSRDTDAPLPPPPTKPDARTAAPPARTEEPSPITRLPIADEVTSLNSPDTTVDDDLATIELLLSEFRKHQGGNPIGENDEIAAALLGGNPKHLSYLPDKGPHLNAAGQLIDRWGTPYFFHQLSGSETEIHSAGPDKELNTADDIVR